MATTRSQFRKNRNDSQVLSNNTARKQSFRSHSASRASCSQSKSTRLSTIRVSTLGSCDRPSSQPSSTRSARYRQRLAYLSDVYSPISSANSVQSSSDQPWMIDEPSTSTTTYRKRVNRSKKLHTQRYTPTPVEVYLNSSVPEDFFPFSDLPLYCQLRIFHFLSIFERGRCRRVCRTWCELLNTSCLWDVVDLSVFELCNLNTVHACDNACYLNYRKRIRSYIAFIASIQPVVKMLKFSLDIGDINDGWMLLVEQLLASLRYDMLKHAVINWKETLVKPFWVGSNNWEMQDYKNMMIKHRHRVKMFTSFLDLFTSISINLSTLVMPIPWSTEFLQYIARLKMLKTIVIQRYFVFQSINQHQLNGLFKAIPQLEVFVLQTWMRSGLHQLYEINSPSLIEVDVSQSRGFYLKSVNIPQVTVFKLLRHPWNGPLIFADSINLPCIYDVLANGAPKLEYINDFKLRDDWRDHLYEDLNLTLRPICSCRKHKRGWKM